MNVWAGLFAAVSIGISATIAWHGGAGSAWVGVGSGSAPLDIIQVGIRAGALQAGSAQYPDTRPHLFLAWGAGEPTDGSYTELDLGPATKASYTFAIRWDGSMWVLSVDGRVRGLVPAPTWKTRYVRAMAEGHDGTLPHVRISRIRRLVGADWSREQFRFLSVGHVHPLWGSDYVEVK